MNLWVIEVRDGDDWAPMKHATFYTRDDGRDYLSGLKKAPYVEGDEYRLVPYARRER